MTRLDRRGRSAAEATRPDPRPTRSPRPGRGTAPRPRARRSRARTRAGRGDGRASITRRAKRARASRASRRGKGPGWPKARGTPRRATRGSRRPPRGAGVRRRTGTTTRRASSARAPRARTRCALACPPRTRMERVGRPVCAGARRTTTPRISTRAKSHSATDPGGAGRRRRRGATRSLALGVTTRGERAAARLRLGNVVVLVREQRLIPRGCPHGRLSSTDQHDLHCRCKQQGRQTREISGPRFSENFPRPRHSKCAIGSIAPVGA